MATKEKFKMRSPIPKKYWHNRKTCILTQLFGENKNRLFYGPKGHDAWDMQTKGSLRFVFHRLKEKLTRRRVSKEREAGIIPILAAHDGYVVSPRNDDYRNGIYVQIMSTCGKYRTMYFHLSKARVWKDDDLRTAYGGRRGNQDFVKAGSVIGWGGNSGRYTTGAHLHFRLQKKVGDTWVSVDPSSYMSDDVIYYRYSMYPKYRTYYYRGKEITASQAESIRNK